MELWFDRFRYGDPNSREYQKRLIDSFVNSVYVFEDKLVLTYNYQYGSETITFEEIEDALGSDLVGLALPIKKLTLTGGLFLLESAGDSNQSKSNMPAACWATGSKTGGHHFFILERLLDIPFLLM